MGLKEGDGRKKKMKEEKESGGRRDGVSFHSGLKEETARQD